MTSLLGLLQTSKKKEGILGKYREIAFRKFLIGSVLWRVHNGA